MLWVAETRCGVNATRANLLSESQMAETYKVLHPVAVSLETRLCHQSSTLEATQLGYFIGNRRDLPNVAFSRVTRLLQQ
jgi:hypothetical protein